MSKTLLFCSLVLGFLGLASAHADPGPMSIWFTTPGSPGNTASWQQEALPVGNGKLAAMVYGGVASEQIQFNEDTIWSGQPHDYSNPNSSPAHLAQLQTESFNFTSDAAFLADGTNWLMGVPTRQAAYQPAGVITLTFPHASVSNYLRSLNLSNATVNVHYDYNGITYNRDVFASAPSNKVIVVRLTASQPGSLSFSCGFSTLQSGSVSAANSNLLLHASVSSQPDSRYYVGGLTNGVKYDARLQVLASGGTVTTTSTSVSVANADSATLLLAVASNFKAYNDLSADYPTLCSNNLAAAVTLGYSALRQAQQADYTNLFNRVVLDLGTNACITQGVGQRKKQIASSPYDPNLVALDFQLGRYLIIAGSRPGSQPLNLQGKWNDATVPGWDSKMTLNINEEMNYWGAEMANLSECTLPLFDLMQDLAVTGNKVARSNYFSSGWVVHHNTDLWRAAAPVNGNDGFWPSGAAWLCQHVWWHYDFTGDTNWLATVGYPLMKGAAQFFQGFLVTHPTYGYKVTCPSYSPEHDEGTYNAGNIPGPTMDNELCRDLFKHVIAATRVLGVDGDLRTNLTTLMAQLPPEKTGSGGQLQEWLEDVDGAGYDAGHRHCSHLVGFFPGDEISLFYTATNANAAKRSVYLRGDASSSLTPWSCSWRLNLRNRLLDGDGAYNNLLFLYGYSKVATNLIFADNNRQLDSIFGRLSGIGEMFLQSQCGDLMLLPALPTQLTNGMVSGLCARGGFEVDNMTWTNSKLTGATILSKCGNICRLRPFMPVEVKLGSNTIAATMVQPGVYQFPTTAGTRYTVLPARVAETENMTPLTSGATAAVVTNAAFSNLRGTLVSAPSQGASITYTVSNLTAGTYRIYVGADAGTNRGIFQLACGPVGGALSNVGLAQDTYSPTNMVYLLPTKLTTPTNLLTYWTNLLQELDCGTWQAPSNGTYSFRFTVVDKNAASSGYNLALDYLKFSAPPVASPSASSSGSPSLNVGLQGQVMVLSWSTNAADYILEQNSGLSADGWQAVSAVSNVLNGSIFVTNSISGGRMFYRLHHP